MSLIKRQYDKYIWALKYRPSSFEELILPDRFIKKFQELVKSKNLMHMIFSGPAGCGKTSSAFLIADMTGCDVLYLNLSNETGIDVLRSKVTSFASSVSLSDVNSKKLVIFDEADRATGALQDGLKCAIEDFSKNCIFIFITNHKNKIIKPIISRVPCTDFIFTPEETKALKGTFYKRVCQILDFEKVDYDKKAIGLLVDRVFPDMRQILTQLQDLSKAGKITIDSIQKQVIVDVDEFFSVLKEKNFPKLRQFIASLTINPQYFYTEIYQHLDKYLVSDSIPEAIILLSKYSYESSFMMDQEINLMACSLELMASCKTK